MSVKFEVTGVENMKNRLTKIAKEFPMIVGMAIFQEANVEMTEAKQRTPVAKNGGTLKASGQVSLPRFSGRNISVQLSFGGAAKTYAIAVHEHLSGYSPPSWVAAEEGGYGINWNIGGTGPKFLESTLNESRPHMASRIAMRISLNAVI